MFAQLVAMGPSFLNITRTTLCLQGVQHRMVLVVIFFEFLKLNFFCFVVAIFDLVQDLEAIFYLL